MLTTGLGEAVAAVAAVAAVEGAKQVAKKRNLGNSIGSPLVCECERVIEACLRGSEGECGSEGARERANAKRRRGREGVREPGRERESERASEGARERGSEGLRE